MKKVTIKFVSDKQANAFMTYFQQQGESDYYEWQSCLGETHINFSYDHDTHTIHAIAIKGTHE